MTQAHVELIVPGLLNLPLHELDGAALQQVTPALHRLLRFARIQAASAADFDDILRQRLGLNQPGLPWAQALQGGVKSSAVLFSPVHLKADINNAIVFPVDEISDDIDILINDLAEFFKDDCDIEKQPDQRWLMTLKTMTPVGAVPHYLSALGKKVTPYLEQAKTNLAWFKLINEMQMFLHQHAVNQRRQQQARPLINSLWCWGADDYQGEKLQDTHWFSDEADLIALGKLYAASTYPLADLKSIQPHKRSFVIDLSLLRALKQNPDSDLMALLIRLEQQCLQPLLNAKATITVHTAAGLDLHYHPRMRWQLWKGARTLSDLQGKMNDQASA